MSDDAFTIESNAWRKSATDETTRKPVFEHSGNRLPDQGAEYSSNDTIEHNTGIETIAYNALVNRASSIVDSFEDSADDGEIKLRDSIKELLTDARLFLDDEVDTASLTVYSAALKLSQLIVDVHTKVLADKSLTATERHTNELRLQQYAQALKFVRHLVENKAPQLLES